MRRLMALVVALCFAACQHAGGGARSEQIAWTSDLPQCGGADDCLRLGSMYAAGDGLPRNHQAANAAYERACQLGSARGCATLGAGLARDEAAPEDKVRGATFLAHACDLGEADACGYAVTLRTHGQDVEKIGKRDRELLARGCKLGAAETCTYLGMVWYAGPRDSSRDLDEASRLFGKGCELGDGAACGKAGLLLQAGAGVARDEKKALAYFERGAGLGDGDSSYQLGRSLERGTNGAKDLAGANRFYEKACEAGVGTGCGNLGMNYQEGAGVERDQVRANALFEKACDLKDGFGCNNLAVAFERGEGVAKDQAGANTLYRRSCELRARLGCLNLGFNYETGAGEGRDPSKASQLYEKACSLGEGRGCRYLASMHHQGVGVARDEKRALGLLEKACALDDPGGCSDLGLALWQRGEKRRAGQLFRKACDLGEGAGCNNLASSEEDPQKARRLLTLACSLGEPRGCDNLASRLDGDPAFEEEAVRSLAALAQRGPELIGEVAQDTVSRIVKASVRLPPRSEPRSNLLDALLRSWRPAEGASAVWREVSLDLLERGCLGEAALAAQRVDDPYVLVAMRVDKRFHRLVEFRPALFDIHRALEREVARLRAAAQREPRSLRRLASLLSSLLKVPRYDEVLQLADDAIRRAESTEAAFDDASEQLPWVMNERARALKGLGRWQDAANQYLGAVRLRGQQVPNVSQALNLAELYCKIDRPADALEALQPVKSLSRYGKMQLEYVKLMAAVELGNHRDVASALAFLRDHQADAEPTLQSALVVSGESDEAARVLIDRLEDPSKRWDALVAVQEFAERSATARMATWRDLERALVARSDVQSAIARVGAVERFDIAPND